MKFYVSFVFLILSFILTSCSPILNSSNVEPTAPLSLEPVSDNISPSALPPTSSWVPENSLTYDYDFIPEGFEQLYFDIEPFEEQRTLI